MLREESGWQSALMPVLTAMVTAVFATSLTSLPATKRIDTAGQTVSAEASPSAWEAYATAWEDPLTAVCDITEAPDDAGSDEKKSKSAPTAVFSNAELSEDSLDNLAFTFLRAREFVNDRSSPAALRCTVVVRPVDGAPGLIASEYRRADRLAIRAAMESERFDFSVSENRIGALCLGSSSGEQRAPFDPMLGTRIAYEIAARFDENNASEAHLALVLYVPSQIVGGRDGLRKAEAFGIKALSRARDKLSEAHDDGSDIEWALLVLRGDSDALSGDVRSLESIQSESDASEDKTSRYVLYTSSTAELRGVPDALLRKPIKASSSPAKIGSTELQPVLPPDIESAQGLAPLYWRFGQNRYLGRVLGSDTDVIVPAIERELRLRNSYFDSRPDASVALICDTGNQYGALFAEAANDAAATDDDAFEVIQYHGPIGVPPRRPLNRIAFDAYQQHREEKISAGARFGPATPTGPQSLDFIERGLARYAGSLRATGRTATAFIVCVYDAKDRRPIIQLIRARFPAAIIVVTDMNAVLMDPLDAGFMRNVIVVSHLGLSAGEAQRERPPFRDHYDTATFLAVRHFFNSPNGYEHWPHDRSSCRECGAGEAEWARELSLAPPPGRVWEITTKGAAALGVAAVEKQTLYDDERTPLPGRWLMHLPIPDLITVLLIWVVVALSVLALSLIPRVSDDQPVSPGGESADGANTTPRPDPVDEAAAEHTGINQILRFSVPHALPALAMTLALVSAYSFRDLPFEASCLLVMPVLAAVSLARPAVLSGFVRYWGRSTLGLATVVTVIALLMWPSENLQILARSTAVIACIAGGALVVAVPFFERSAAVHA